LSCSAETRRRLSELLGGPYRLAPLLMSFGLLASIALSLGPKGFVFDLAFLTVLAAAMVGGLLELYYLTLLGWASRVSRGSCPGFLDALYALLYALVLIGLYYTLVGIALISWRLNEASREFNCACASNTIAALATAGLYLAVSQTCVSLCVSERLAREAVAGAEGAPTFTSSGG